MDLKRLTERRVFLLENKDFEYEISDPLDPRFIPVPYQGAVQKHQEHDQSSHGNWAHGSAVGDFTLESGADSKKLATYSHPNGTRVIFQNLSKVESSSPMVKETLETISDLSAKYPVPNLTFVVQSGEGGGVVTRGYDGVCFSQSGDKTYSERVEAWLKYKNMPPATEITAPYIAIRQRVIAPDSAPIRSGYSIRPKRTPERNTAYLKELITHEWGHALDTRTNAVSAAQFRNRDQASTSAYGNKNGREFFAETFAAFELGGLVKDRPDNTPNYSKAAEYLQMDSLKGKVSKASFEGFICYENFETGEPLLIEDGLPLEFDLVLKHQEHDQSSHGSWATGELSGEQKAVVSAWTSLSNKSSWRQIANDLSEGKTPNASESDTKTVKTLIDAIKQNGVIPAEALGRAELLTTGLRWQGAVPKVGDTLKNELSSATLDERTSERFSQYSDFGGSKGKPVIFHYGFQTKGLDVSRAGADVFADEQEWLVSGTFKITDRYSENGITHLNLKPVEAVKKHQQGLHDQRTHGSWAGGGGAGVDITGELDEVFFNDRLDVKESTIFPGSLRIPMQVEMARSGENTETVALIEQMSEAQVASGQAYGDNALKIIAERQGFTGKPKTVASAEDLEEIQKTDGGILVYRGLSDYSKEVIEISARHSRAEIDGGKPYKQIPQILRETKELEAAKVSYSAEQAQTDFREGEYFGGWGVFGNGTYTTVRIEEANTYTQTREYDNGKLGNGKIMAMLIPRDAKAPTKDVVKTVIKDLVYGGEPSHRNNVGRRLASLGYQYYDAGYVQSDKGGIFVVLDRSMLTVAEKAVG